jgi:hypothetical protein
MNNPASPVYTVRRVETTSVALVVSLFGEDGDVLSDMI